MPATNRRVVINGRFTASPMTGVQRYAHEIVGAMDTLREEDHPSTRGLDLVLALPPGGAAPARLRTIPSRRVGRLNGYLWEQVDLARFARRDVVLGLGNFGPLASPRAITTVHDAHVWLMPESFSRGFRLAYRALLPLVIRRSRHWTTVSRYSEGALRGYRVADRAASAITPNGHEHARAWDAARSTLDTSRLPSRFVLALGNRTPNKNLALVHALAPDLARHGIGVVLAGGSNPRVFGADGDAAPTGVVELGRVSDDDIALLMGRALACLFPSFHEAFGLPPVEAMVHGCPVIASDRSALPEVLGEAALLRDPDDRAAWLDAILTVHRDPTLRARLIERGRERAALYSWRRSALALLDLVHATP